MASAWQATETAAANSDGKLGSGMLLAAVTRVTPRW